MAERSMMRRRGESDTIVFAAVAVIVIIIGAILLGYVSTEKVSSSSSSSSSGSSGTSASGTGSSTSSSSPSTSSISGIRVTIPNGAGVPTGGPGYSPDVLTVTSGTTVVWTNNDTAHHTVTSASGNGTLNSGDMAPGATYSFTFNTPGTYDYICTYHYWMKGTIVVTGPQASNSSATSTSSSAASQASSGT